MHAARCNRTDEGGVVTWGRIVALCLAVSAWTAQARAAEPVLKPGCRLAIAGDSITEQKLYSKFIETYLLACTPQLDVHTLQLGWSGERAPGFAGRMANDLLPWKPDVVTLCYGMNDGAYVPYQPHIGDTYRKAMADIVVRLRQAGAVVVVGSPGVVDSATWKPAEPEADVYYNDNLAHLRDIAADIARSNACPFANVHDTMMDAMRKAKAALGDAFPVAGGDGVHPGANGQLAMAHAFLDALGVDGAIGAITLNWGSPAEATEGHRVQSATNGVITIASSRYPVCFGGDAKDPGNPASILPFLPFQERFNRFTLTVHGLPWPQAQVKWGDTAKTFSREQLEKGLNLAAEFPANPFSKPFAAVMDAVGAKQAFETQMVKGIITNLRAVSAMLPGDEKAAQSADTLRERLLARHAELDATTRAALQPVTHVIEIKP